MGKRGLETLVIWLSGSLFIESEVII